MLAPLKKCTKPEASSPGKEGRETLGLRDYMLRYGLINLDVEKMAKKKVRMGCMRGRHGSSMYLHAGGGKSPPNPA